MDASAATAPKDVRREPTYGTARQLQLLLEAVRGAPERTRLAVLAAATSIVILLTSLTQVGLNAWNQPFYDSLAGKDLARLGPLLVIFAALALLLVVLNVSQTWLHENIKIKLREWLTRDLTVEWLRQGRPFRISLSGTIGENPDQRVQEDAKHLCELTADLAVGLFQSTLLLLSFVGVLWMLSTELTFRFGDHSFAIPGYMVWCALLYSALGSLLSWQVGKRLIGLTADRYSREAAFRFALVRVSENADPITLHRGEAYEHRQLEAELERVLSIMRHIAGAFARLTWVTAGYGWLAIIVPFLVAAPAYFGGGLSFGGLMMAVGAFIQVQQALRWFVDNFRAIADWQATLFRVTAFRSALTDLEARGGDKIAYRPHPGGRLSFERLEVYLPGGRAVLEEAHVDVRPSEHLLVIGSAGSGKSTLLRAIAELWTWGSGTIQLPPREQMMFMPQRPLLPRGSLRAALCYPDPESRFSNAEIARALERTQLRRLCTCLDVTQAWEKDLTLQDHQRIAFARMLLHRPKWVLTDDAIDALDDDNRSLLVSLFQRELAEAAVVSFSRHMASNGFYNRTVRLKWIGKESDLGEDAAVRVVPLPWVKHPNKTALQGVIDGETLKRGPT
jgi:putative ATP-binding cassette transporter